ncbi:hypothetical protein Tco_0686560 [Tanacetum coccineum]
MVLQLTDFTSEITDEELREFTSEYYIPFALHPAVPAANASIADFPEGKGTLTKPDENSTGAPGSYSMRITELINETDPYHTPSSEAFMPHGHIPQTISPQEVPTFIAIERTGGCLSFLLLRLVVVVHLSKPKLVTQGVRPLRDGEEYRVGKVRRDVAGRKVDAAEVDSSKMQRGSPSYWGVLRCGYVKEVVEATQWFRSAAGDEHAAAQLLPPKTVLRPSRVNNGSLNGGALQLVKIEQERADAAEYKASCHWAIKYLEGGKNNHFARLDDFRQKVEGLLEKQEEKLRKLSIEYDEELTLESQEVRQSFGDVVKCALARGKAEVVEELHEKKLLTVPAAQAPGYNEKAYEELVAAMEAMKLLELPHIAQLERDQDYFISVPIFARPRDILNPFALEKEVPLKESLEAHAIRLAKKKGVKGKAILCGVGAAHLPRSDGVPVSGRHVSPKRI